MQTDYRSSLEAGRLSLAPVGIMLAAVSILAVVALLHHPVAHGADAARILASMRAQEGMDQIVHAAMAIIFGLLTVGMFLFASRLGVWRFPVLLGLISFGVALALLVLAAMTDGFVIPVIVNTCPSPPAPACLAEATTLLRLEAIQIEFLTRFGLAAIAIAIVSWSLALIRTPAMPRWAGIGGLAAAGLQVAALFATSRLAAHSLVAVMAAQIAWYLIVAALMIARRGPFAAAPAKAAFAGASP